MFFDATSLNTTAGQKAYKEKYAAEAAKPVKTTVKGFANELVFNGVLSVSSDKTWAMNTCADSTEDTAFQLTLSSNSETFPTIAIDGKEVALHITLDGKLDTEFTFDGVVVAASSNYVQLVGKKAIAGKILGSSELVATVSAAA